MELTAKQKANAQGIFEGNDNLKSLFMNSKGEFFTNRNYADMSVRGKTSIEVRRADLIGASEVSSGKVRDANPSTPKLVVETEDGKKLKFNIPKGDVPEVGAKDKIGNKNASGIYKVDPQLSYKFEKGVLAEVIEPTK